MFADVDDGGVPAVALSVAEEPVTCDRITLQDDTKIYVVWELVDTHAEHALHIEETHDGLQLALVPQGDQEQ